MNDSIHQQYSKDKDNLINSGTFNSVVKGPVVLRHDKDSIEKANSVTTKGKVLDHRSSPQIRVQQSHIESLQRLEPFRQFANCKIHNDYRIIGLKRADKSRKPSLSNEEALSSPRNCAAGCGTEVKESSVLNHCINHL